MDKRGLWDSDHSTGLVFLNAREKSALVLATLKPRLSEQKAMAYLQVTKQPWDVILRPFKYCAYIHSTGLVFLYAREKSALVLATLKPRLSEQKAMAYLQVTKQPWDVIPRPFKYCAYIHLMTLHILMP
jgi:hypothetical protein